MPGKITHSVGGVRTEITQTMTPLTDAGPNVLAAPENAQMHGLCTTYRRPFGVSMQIGRRYWLYQGPMVLCSDYCMLVGVQGARIGGRIICAWGLDGRTGY